MQTKRNMWLLSALLIIILCITMLTACGGSKLDGTYHSQGLISQSFTFDGDQIIITYNLLGQEYTWKQPFSQSGNVINIGGTEFKK